MPLQTFWSAARGTHYLKPKHPYSTYIVLFRSMRTKQSHVYILANKSHTVIYIGVTSNLSKRLSQHINNVYEKSFTCRYNCKTLVYFEAFNSIVEAIKREKQLKGWRREKKINLIKSMNPTMQSLNHLVASPESAPGAWRTSYAPSAWSPPLRLSPQHCWAPSRL